MSIVHTLKKLVDPIAARAEEAEKKSRRQNQATQDREHGDPVFTCRVCEHVDSQGAYCPKCLADTMVRTEPTP